LACSVKKGRRRRRGIKKRVEKERRRGDDRETEMTRRTKRTFDIGGRRFSFGGGIESGEGGWWGSTPEAGFFEGFFCRTGRVLLGKREVGITVGEGSPTWEEKDHPKNSVSSQKNLLSACRQNQGQGGCDRA